MDFTKETWTKISVVLGIILIIGVIITFYSKEQPQYQLNADSPSQKNTTEKLELVSNKETAQVDYIYVDVKGAVVSPGVYKVNSGLRVKDVIKKAGGFLKEADTSQVNLAQKLADEMVIFVPVKGVSNHVTGQMDPQNQGNKVSVNLGTESDFESLPGIGPSKAAAIITYREQHGPYTSIEQIKDVRGIGDKTFEAIKKQLKLY